MADGIVRGYEEAGVKPPILLYTGHDCCGNSCIHSLFASWPVLLVRLDAWHFMRHIATGFTTDSHPLYGTFMAKLSRCIFEWSQEDVTQLVTAKRAELSMEGLPNLSDKEVFKRINKKELALHCHRRTRGAERTAALISDLIEAFSGEHGADTMGVPLLDTDRMKEIWESQPRHITCIQDPQGIQLYTQTGTLTKGGVILPVYRCARGSTSLESFHLHLDPFIPGRSPNEISRKYWQQSIQYWFSFLFLFL